MLSQSNGQTVPQVGCSTGKCSDSKEFFVVSLVDARGAKTRLGGEPQMHWKVAESIGGLCHSCKRQDFVINTYFDR